MLRDKNTTCKRFSHKYLKFIKNNPFGLRNCFAHKVLCQSTGSVDFVLFCESANLEPCETHFHRLKDVKNIFFASKRKKTLEAKKMIKYR